MLLQTLTGKRICILGFGREGRATLEAIQKAGIECKITIADQQDQIPDSRFQSSLDSGTWNLEFSTGSNYLQHLDRFDIIIRSPGIPPCSELDAVKDRITNATQIFLDEAAAAGALVIGVTGSKGKSTTASLIAEILRFGGLEVSLVGNIGEPALKHIKDLNKNKIFVQEMSSYQLMDLRSGPPIAVITAFFPEHLDYHTSEAAYLEAKKQITSNQSTKDIVFYSEGSPGAKKIADVSPGKQIPVSTADAPIRIDQTKLIGQHNLMNIALASAVARHLGVTDERIAEAVKTFAPLPHRLQPCGEHGGVSWVDDSISTTPESAIAALDALGVGVRTMILGGQDRGNDFTQLAERIRRSNVHTVILLGESGARIRRALLAASVLVDIHRAASMKEAVQLARRHTTRFQSSESRAQNPIVLLSPASPSYDMFENFEERGKAFIHAILQTKP